MSSSVADAPEMVKEALPETQASIGKSQTCSMFVGILADQMTFLCSLNYT